MIEWRMKAQVLGGGGPQRPFAFAPLSPSSRGREGGRKDKPTHKLSSFLSAVSPPSLPFGARVACGCARI